MVRKIETAETASITSAGAPRRRARSCGLSVWVGAAVIPPIEPSLTGEKIFTDLLYSLIGNFRNNLFKTVEFFATGESNEGAEGKPNLPLR